MGNTSEDRQKALETALAQINKQFGAGSVGKLGEKEAVDIETISTGSLAVDLALGVGGLPKGRIVEIYGPESSGKTLLTLHAIAEVQKEGGIAAFVDAEHALDPVWASKIGVDVENLIVSQPDNGEQALEIIEKLVRSRAIDLIVVDSVAALVPSKEIEGDMGDSHMGLQARLMSQGLRKITGVIHNTNTTVIFINQLRSKIGVMFGCFQYSTRVQLADGTSEKIGKIVNQRKQVEVLSYNAESGKIEPRKIVNWFNNGKAEKFLQFKVENYQGSGFSKFAATENHQIATPQGYESAGDLKIGDEVNIVGPNMMLSTGIIRDISVKPKTRSMIKFDIEVEGNHNYFVDGVMVHNSPETTTGGNALKYYASVRLDIRRISQIKEGEDIIGARTRVKVVKNKVAAPFKQAEFDILFKKGSEGFSRESDIRDLGVHAGIIKKSGAWFTYDTTQLGQGGEKTRVFLKENPEIANEIEAKIKAKILGNEVDLDMESSPEDEVSVESVETEE